MLWFDVRIDEPATSGWFDVPVERLFAFVSFRAEHTMLRAKVETLGQAWAAVRSDRLLWMPNCGTLTLRELRRALSRIASEGLERARWGADGCPRSVAELAERALASLKPRERVAVVEALLHGRTHSDVARELGVHNSTVGQILARAVRRSQRRFSDMAAELIRPALDELERRGGTATARQLRDLTDDATAGEVVFVLQMSGEFRYGIPRQHRGTMPFATIARPPQS